MNKLTASALTASAALVALTAGCGSQDGESSSSGRSTLGIDGSSTVFPITAAVAEEFQIANRDVRVAVSYSGTGGGFKKFIANETDVNNASRPIRESEITALAKKGMGFIELPVAYDGLTVILNPQNDWVDHLTVEELQMIWEPSSSVSMWSDVRDGWPEEEIALYGAGTDSGTFDYFTEAIMGESGASRSDYTATEDDNLTVQGVTGDRYAMGYLGIAYYEENKDTLRSAPIKDGDKDPVSPSLDTVMKGTYTPLSRPLFIYVSTTSAERTEVQNFIEFYMSEGAALVRETGYVPLPDLAYDLALERFENRVTGSIFEHGGATVGVKIEDLLRMEQAEAGSEG